MAAGDALPAHPSPAKCPKEPSPIATTIRSLEDEDPAPAATTGGREPRQRQKARRDPHIHRLGEDLLLEVFLRLPSLATLVRAACACRAWRRAVASSPAFRRRFRALHAPPLLGLFFLAPRTGDPQLRKSPNAPAFPAFVPARRRDRDLTAAVRGGDFFLTTIEDIPEEEGPGGWEILDCCRGRVLLMNWDDGGLVVFNPLTQVRDGVFDHGTEDTFIDSRGHFVHLRHRLLFSDEDPASFRVVFLAHDESRIRANILCSDNWEWSVLPWVDVPARSDNGDRWIQDEPGMQSNGHLYWVYTDQSHLISLDTTTMEFSVTELADCLKDCSFDIGETKDGAACIVYSDGLDIGVLMHTRGDDGVERWERERLVPMDTELRRVLQGDFDGIPELSVFAVRDGCVYLSTSLLVEDPEPPCWFLSLCLETMRLERLFRRTYDNDVYPYVMGWPPSLVGDYGSFAPEDAM